MEFKLPEYNLTLMLPEIFLFIWALVVFTFDLVSKRKSESAPGYLALLGLLISGAILAVTQYGIGFGNMFVSDPMATFFKIIFLGAAFMAIASSFGITQKKIVNHRGEFFGLILFSTVGMMFLASSKELLSLYIGLELTTIPLFVLAAFYKDNKLSVEAGIKYFVIGAFSSALLLYGLSFLYGLSGTTDLDLIRYNIANIHISYRNIGVILIMANITIIAGIGFKLALPPFHQWAPDVYEGAPTPIAAFLSVGSKAVGLVAFAKIFLLGLPAFFGSEMSPNDWGMLVAIASVLAMIIGNVAAIRQNNIKRMLAYSSIAQAGYVMIGMISLNHHGLASVGYFMFAYMFANMGAFAAVAIFEDNSGSCQIPSYKGLSKTSPFFAISLSVFLLSLVGIPPLAGFMAKYKVFAAAIYQATVNPDSSSWLYWLVGIALLTSVFSLFYYANVIREMFFSNEDSPYTISYSLPSYSVLVIGLVGVILAGLFPEPILNFASEMTSTFGFIIQ
jgi:proton-translocating NADH-quinone oxidoreductase chain N